MDVSDGTKLVGFETCGERGTIITNGNQSASGGETINVCTDDDISLHNGKAQTYKFQRKYSESGTLRRIFVELPPSLGGTVEWVNPYQRTTLPESGISLATMLDGIARAVREDTQPLWTGEMGQGRSGDGHRRTPINPDESATDPTSRFNRILLKRMHSTVILKRSSVSIHAKILKKRYGLISKSVNWNASNQGRCGFPTAPSLKKEYFVGEGPHT